MRRLFRGVRACRGVRAWWSRRTIQFRISATAAVVALIGLGVIAQVSAGFIGSLLLESIDTELRGKVSSAAGRVVAGNPPPVIAETELRVLDTAGNPVDGLAPVDLKTSQIDDLKSGDGVLQFDRGGNGPWEHRWVGTVVADPAGQPRLVLAGAGLVGYAGILNRAGHALVVGSVVAAGMVCLATWWAVRRSLRPVEQMRGAAGSLPEGDRLPVPESPDELRALADELNAMLARRDADTEWLRRFTGDAAHELRNPVAAIRAQAEVAVAHPDPEVAQETLQDIANETQRMSDLVDGLLALARAESSSQPSRPVELVAAVRAAVDRSNVREVRPQVQVQTSMTAVTIQASPTEVSTVLDNLITNALRYARALVRVTLLPTADSVRLFVDDDGPGIPEAHRALVFDRLHRVEPDRARGTGGSGLGLALVAEAVRRGGGSVRAMESPEGGARIEVRWPVRWRGEPMRPGEEGHREVT